MALYLSFYFGSIFLFICSIDKHLKAISNKIIFFLSIVILLLFAGFRYGIATDYWSYYDIFREKEGIQRIEPGFVFLIRAYKIVTFSGSYNGFVFFIAVLSIVIKYCFFKKLRNPFIALVFYIALFYINLEYNVIRQGLASSLICYAVYCTKKKDAFLFICLAATIHISSFMFLPLYFLCINKNNEKIFNIKTIPIIILFAILFRLFVLRTLLDIAVSLIGIKESSLINQAVHYFFYSSDFTITMGFIRRFVIIVLFIILNNRYPVNNCYFNIYLVGFFIYMIFMGNDILAHRMCLSFDVFVIPLYANLGIRYTRKNLIVIIILFSMLFVNYWSPLKGEGYALPYQTYLNNI
jgi:hypothetical protein